VRHERRRHYGNSVECIHFNKSLWSLCFGILTGQAWASSMLNEKKGNWSVVTPTVSIAKSLREKAQRLHYSDRFDKEKSLSHRELIHLMTPQIHKSYLVLRLHLFTNREGNFVNITKEKKYFYLTS
jgi:hypothetical protein